MNETLITIVAWLLVPGGLLPVFAAFVLSRYRNADSHALRDRWHLAIVLAFLGGVSAAIAVTVITSSPAGPLWPAFGIVILIADIVSGKWLVDFWQGRFRG